jgi:hypothetical protein
MPTRRLIDVSLPVLPIELEGFISFNEAEGQGLTLVERLVALTRQRGRRAHGGKIERVAVH